jgi:hypothetical protein
MSSATVRPEPSRPAPVLYGDLPNVLKQASILASLAFVFIEGLLFYRLWAQLTASIADGAPLSWLYDLAGWIVSPFRAFEGGPIHSGDASVEFATLVAIEAVLISGLFGVGLLYTSFRLAQVFAPNPWRIDTAPFADAFARFDAWLGRACQEGVSVAANATSTAIRDRGRLTSGPLPVITSLRELGLKAGRGPSGK